LKRALNFFSRTIESLRNELGVLKEMVLSFASGRGKPDASPKSNSTPPADPSG
jgi:hypothetical protein